MKKHNFKLYIKIFFALLFAVVAVSFTSVQKKTPANHISVTNKSEIFATISADKTTIDLQSAPNTTFYDALMQAKNAGKITFSGKNYPGLGFFVTEIGTLHANNGKNLIYYVNGKESSVGVSSYKLKDGDVIEWKLE